MRKHWRCTEDEKADDDDDDADSVWNLNIIFIVLVVFDNVFFLSLHTRVQEKLSEINHALKKGFKDEIFQILIKI